MSHHKTSVGVLFGGSSPEREVSLNSGWMVLQSLDLTKYHVQAFDTGQRETLSQLIQQPPDVALIALHGQYGEDGTIQGLLELLNVPYTGSGIYSSALCIDKVRTKECYRAHHIPTPEWIVFCKGEPIDLEPLESFAYPLIVKPSLAGSSVGVFKANSRTELEAALAKAFDFCQEILVEPCISGTELTVAVLGGSSPRALPVIEIVPPQGFFDYTAKYTPGLTQEIVPARISLEHTRQAQELALQVHQALGCWGVSRTDMFLSPAGRLWVLETNTCPGLTATSLLPKAARAAGLSLPQLFDAMIASAYERHRLQGGIKTVVQDSAPEPTPAVSFN